MGGRVHSLRPSIGDATLRAQDLSLVASKVVDEMLVDITRVPDAPIKCSELRQYRVVPGLDDPIHRVRLQGNDPTGKQSDGVAKHLRELEQADAGECTLYVRSNSTLCSGNESPNHGSASVTRGCHMPAISPTASDAGVSSISRWK
jgi:hypothetical protein